MKCRKKKARHIYKKTKNKQKQQQLQQQNESIHLWRKWWLMSLSEEIMNKISGK